MEAITLENKLTGIILGHFEAETREQALEQLARNAGYRSYTDIPHFEPTEIIDYKTNFKVN